ncbi:MAG: DNA mismatch repair protein MutS [Planctomycetaceae bacterium]|nr:DNA mismatch repair protein MutS [Planctomycetaceae bacterium]
MPDAPRLTPMMERYLAVKSENPGALLLFRMGDFYELFHEDAETAAKLLGLTLTSRDKGSPNPVPMAGFPYHSLQPQLQKLIKAGLRVAICEQVEDPKTAKGMVRREVTQVVTPGTLTDDNLLDPRTSNYLASLHVEKSGSPRAGLAWIDVSTGRFVVADLAIDHVADEFARLSPSECLVAEGVESSGSRVEGQKGSLDAQLSTLNSSTLWTKRPAFSFGRDSARKTLQSHFGTGTLEGFDLDEDSPAIAAAGALLDYVRETQKSALGHITRIEPFRRGTTLLIDEATRRSLELTKTLREGRRDGSLLAVLDESVTPMGSRLIAEWLSGPLTDASEIEKRLDAVAELAGEPVFCRDVREQFEKAYDLERLTGRVATRRAGPRDLVCLAKTLALLPKLKAKLAGRKSSLLREFDESLDLCPETRAAIEQALVEEPPLNVAEGGVVREGHNAQLDEFRDLARGGKAWMAKYQAKEIERTGITTLKVGFNKVFGYYLEVTAAQRSKVPDDYIRKQTLKNQERFITPELKEYEDKVLRAEERAIALEQELFEALKEQVAHETPRLQGTAAALAALDALAGLATLAIKGGWCRPEIVAEPILDIRNGRHPVLDRLMPPGNFVPNDVVLGRVEGGVSRVDGEGEEVAQPSTLNSQPVAAGRVQIITGPNMAGKSTYIRQAALVTILAQMGSFVPASSAVVGLADRVFARVGASDELGRGQSTFMVEMTETARILNAATERSLVILDEIGRGTSTYDGVSLAWAVTEYLHDVVRCRTLFATHYHELTDLTQSLKDAANWNVAVREDQGDIAFLHKIVPGSTNKSYGLHVAKLAGVPPVVIDRAKAILASLEAEHVDANGRPKVPQRKTRDDRQLSLFDETHPVLDRLREMNLDEMTPMHALQELHRMREQLASR